jgi:RNA polymerase sigma factor (sigma-70 family)
MAATSRPPVIRYIRRLAAGRPADLADGQLLERFASRRDEAAFAALVHRHGPLVLAVCRRVLADAHAAQDAFQDTFLVLARKAAALARPGSLAPWLYGVAYRTALKARTRAARRRGHERRAAAARPLASAPDEPGRAELRPALDAAVAALPEKYRAPLVLCYGEGRTVDEAARLLGCPRGTVATRLARARERLRRRLGGLALSLPAGLLAPAARAGVPAALAGSTVRGVAAGAITKGVQKVMSAMKLKAALLVLTLGTAGVGLLSRGLFGAAHGGSQEAARSPATTPHEGGHPASPYIIEPPDILELRVRGTLPDAVQALAGQHLVRPDGSIGLGAYGAAQVAGLTTERAADAVATRLKAAGAADGLTVRQLRRGLRVEVVASNSKVCYVVVDSADQGQQVYRLPLRGGETVLDMLAQLPDLLPHLGRRTIRLDRPGKKSLPVDWKGITQRGEAKTNYTLRPGDRISITPDTGASREKGRRHRNPLSGPQGTSYVRFFEEAMAAVHDRFGGVAYANRYEGRIESDPVTSPGKGLWQGRRRRGVVSISCSAEYGYQVEVKVFRERRVHGTEPGMAEIAWQDDGRDEDLEQAILRRLARMNKNDPGK